jgi:hypothetical protein
VVPGSPQPSAGQWRNRIGVRAARLSAALKEIRAERSGNMIAILSKLNGYSMLTCGRGWLLASIHHGVRI